MLLLNLTLTEKLIEIKKKQKEFVPMPIVYVVRRIAYVQQRMQQKDEQNKKKRDSDKQNKKERDSKESEAYDVRMVFKVTINVVIALFLYPLCWG
jgi:hypothetical protein